MTGTTMKERIAKELAAKERTPAGSATGPDHAVAPARPHVSDTSVGTLFDFSNYERSMIKVMIADYERNATAARSTLLALNLSVLDLDVVRSRCALITERLDRTDAGALMELHYPLRATLGDACSLHARKLARLEDKTLPQLLVDTGDVQRATDATRHIANKIGEQLVLFVESKDDEK